MADGFPALHLTGSLFSITDLTQPEQPEGFSGCENGLRRLGAGNFSDAAE
jgi:hypothetical protein